MNAGEDLVTVDASDAETWLLDDLRDFAGVVGEPPDGWRYATVYGLLLDVGRLFTPQSWPDGEPPGELGRCYVESVSWAAAQPDTLAYVEGLAWRTYPQEHAWCAQLDTGRMLDPTCPTRLLAPAYIGLPVRADAAAALMFQHRGPLLGHTALTREWMQHGVPAGLLLDVGRPVPSATVRKSRQAR